MNSIVHCFVKLLHIERTPRPKNPDNELSKQEEVVAQPVTLTSESIPPRLETPQNGVSVVPDPNEAPKTLPAQVIPEIAPVRKPTADLTSSNIEEGVQLPLDVSQTSPSNTFRFELSPFKSLATPGHSRRNSAESSSDLSRADSRGSSTTVHWLKEQLENARLECHLRPHSFVVPKDVQENLITESTIAKDIQAHNADITDNEAKEHAKKACQCAGRLYATLAYIKHGADICALLTEGITDKDLPLVRKQTDRSALYRQDGSPVKAMETWKWKHLEKFDRVQWWMTSPVFKYGKHYSLDEKTVLPFIPLDANDGTLEKKQGGYSEVYPVRIHPAHHGFWKSARQDNEPLVAVKALFSSEKTEFQKESTILHTLGPKNHPHLIKLLATYEIGNKYHLMFPYANANLRKYWEDRPTPNFDGETVLWSLTQMSGIASGLQLIHDFKVTVPLSVPGAGTGNVRLGKGKGLVQLKVEKGEQWFGRHGDIKPENVLWFARDQNRLHPNRDPMGVLQIADFGLGRFHGRDSRSGRNPETIISSPTYEPPECKMRLPVSRAYDIWSLGCIYLEFITWLLRGSAAIDGFADYRGREATDTEIDDDNFFTIATEEGVPKAYIREEVTAWSAELHSHNNCSQLIHELLDLTMSDLLVVEAEKRSRASWLCIKLKELLRRAETDSEYLLKPVPRKPASGRSNSSPLLETPKIRGKRNSVTFLDQENSNLPKTQFKLHVTENPRDLVLRNLGTPNFKAKNVGKNPTWPLPQRQRLAP